MMHRSMDHLLASEAAGQDDGTIGPADSTEMEERNMAADLEAPSRAGQEEHAVWCRDVCCSYGKREVLHNLNLTVPLGQIYALLGPSGCGKTTLLKCIMGTLKISQGHLTVLGKPPGFPGHGVPGKRVGYMPQELTLCDDLTISENLYFFGRKQDLTSEEIQARVAFLIDFLDLPQKHRLVKNLSGDQKRRVSLAVALLHNPELLILDEPTAGMDPVIKAKFWDHLEELVKTSKVSVIITAHYIEEARRAHVTLEDAFLHLCETVDQGGPEQDQDGPEQDQDGPEQDQDGPEQDQGGPEQDQGGPEQDQGGPEQDQGGPEQDQGGPEQDQGGPEQDQGGPEQDQCGPEQDQGFSGVSSMEMILAQLLTLLFVISVQITLLLFVFLVFKIPNKGSLVLVIILIVLQGITGVSFGLVISASVDNVQTANQIVLNVFFLVLVLSGIIWPVESISYPLRYLSLVLPQTYATEALRSIMNRGWGLSQMVVWRGFAVTLGWSAFFFILAAVIMKMRA